MREPTTLTLSAPTPSCSSVVAVWDASIHPLHHCIPQARLLLLPCPLLCGVVWLLRSWTACVEMICSSNDDCVEMLMTGIWHLIIQLNRLNVATRNKLDGKNFPVIYKETVGGLENVFPVYRFFETWWSCITVFDTFTAIDYMISGSKLTKRSYKHSPTYKMQLIVALEHMWSRNGWSRSSCSNIKNYEHHYKLLQKDLFSAFRCAIEHPCSRWWLIT